jgi:uncharacterized membrane protein YgdD (TMEM256/DUF423 family)
LIRAWLIAAAIGGFFAVIAGAAAAHLAAGSRTAELLRAGALYGMIHAAALIALIAMAQAHDRRDVALLISGWSFAAGMLLFSLSLFALALTGIPAFGWVTPFGGVGLLLGWAALGLHALRRSR